jgi:hypothetical protein
MTISDVLLFILALLVSDRAGSLAGRLAGSLALAASALGSAVLERRAVESLDMFHELLPPRVFFPMLP